MSTEIERYLNVSAKIEIGDIDWQEARAFGLSPDERFILTYFSDIESQTIRYLRTLLGMKIALQPAIAGFLTTWSYEEFFHGHALARLLSECGHPLDANRVEKVSRKARLNELLENAFGPLLSHAFSSQFPAVYMSFGAVQEITTLCGYERLEASTRNPVLRTLCARIAKQERRHFAWYFNNARVQLNRSRSTRFLARKILELVWVPVGAGVKTTAEVNRLFSTLFPTQYGIDLVRKVDARIGTLPGMTGIRLMERYFEKTIDAGSRYQEAAYELG